MPAERARKAIPVTGKIVTPGLVDIHVHAFGGFSGWLFPDEHCLPNGTTTVVDTGSAGWKTFERRWTATGVRSPRRAAGCAPPRACAVALVTPGVEGGRNLHNRAAAGEATGVVAPGSCAHASSGAFVSLAQL